MDDNELSREDFLVLCDIFPVITNAQSLLRTAGFPGGAIPQTSANGREFWLKVVEEIAAGVMPEARAKILGAALEWYPANRRLRALVSAPAAAPAPGPAAAG